MWCGLAGALLSAQGVQQVSTQSGHSLNISQHLRGCFSSCSADSYVMVVLSLVIVISLAFVLCLVPWTFSLHSFAFGQKFKRITVHISGAPFVHSAFLSKFTQIPDASVGPSSSLCFLSLERDTGALFQLSFPAEHSGKGFHSETWGSCMGPLISPLLPTSQGYSPPLPIVLHLKTVISYILPSFILFMAGRPLKLWLFGLKSVFVYFWIGYSFM